MVPTPETFSPIDEAVELYATLVGGLLWPYYMFRHIGGLDGYDFRLAEQEDMFSPRTLVALFTQLETLIAKIESLSEGEAVEEELFAKVQAKRAQFMLGDIDYFLPVLKQLEQDVFHLQDFVSEGYTDPKSLIYQIALSYLLRTIKDKTRDVLPLVLSEIYTFYPQLALTLAARKDINVSALEILGISRKEPTEVLPDPLQRLFRSIASNQVELEAAAGYIAEFVLGLYIFFLPQLDVQAMADYFRDRDVSSGKDLLTLLSNLMQLSVDSMSWTKHQAERFFSSIVRHTDVHIGNAPRDAVGETIMKLMYSSDGKDVTEGSMIYRLVYGYLLVAKQQRGLQAARADAKVIFDKYYTLAFLPDIREVLEYTPEAQPAGQRENLNHPGLYINEMLVDESTVLGSMTKVVESIIYPTEKPRRAHDVGSDMRIIIGIVTEQTQFERSRVSRAMSALNSRCWIEDLDAEILILKYQPKDRPVVYIWIERQGNGNLIITVKPGQEL